MFLRSVVSPNRSPTLASRLLMLKVVYVMRKCSNPLRTCQKVQCALPAIDVGPPPTRSHVCCKLKKQQSEQERKTQIEQDNCRLLQRMGTIMRTNRLDNHWVNQPPK